MKKLLLILLTTSCVPHTFTIQQSKPTPHIPELYLPSKTIATEIECTLTASIGFGLECKALPRKPVFAPCLPGYHQERQVFCTDSNETTQSQMVCHLDVAKSYTNICGLECTLGDPAPPQIIMPPNLDKQDAFRIK